MFQSDMRRWRADHAILSILLLSGNVVSQDCTYSDTSIYSSEMLCSHNGYRARHQASALIYNQSMAQAAATYVSQCIFEHPALVNQGSNLAAGFDNPYDAMDAWYLEVNDPGYNFSSPGPQDGTLHFTQLVWAASTQLGCGAYFCNGVNNVPGWYAACYYYVEGNVVLFGNEGYFFQQNVLQNTSAAVASRFNCAAPPAVCPTTTSTTSTPISTSTSITSSSSSSPLSSSTGAGTSTSTSIGTSTGTSRTSTSIGTGTGTSSISNSVASSAPSGTSSTSLATATNQGGSTGSSSVVTNSLGTLTIAPVVPTQIPVGSATTQTTFAISPIYDTSNGTSSIVSTSTIFFNTTTLLNTATSAVGGASSRFVTLSSSDLFATRSTSEPASAIATTVATSAATSAATPAAIPIQLAFFLPNTVVAGRKRQSSALRFLASGGTITADQSQAVIVNVVGNQLFSGNSVFSTNPGTANQIFMPVSPAGSISTAFTLVDNVLFWANPSFTITGNSQAQFAVVASLLYAAFTSLPAGATVVQLTAVPAASPTSSSVLPSTLAPGSTTGAMTGAMTGATTGPVTGAATMVPVSSGLTSIVSTYVTTITGSGGQTVIRATQPTIISTDGIVFIVNPTNTAAANVNGASPTAYAGQGLAVASSSLPICPAVQAAYVKVGGGAINVVTNINIKH